MRRRSAHVAISVLFLSQALALAARRTATEVELSSDEFKKLDTFEAHVLAKADKVFAKEDFKGASAEYDSFIIEFPRSKVIPYALLRKARCLHLLDKRFLAIKEYSEVLDYFPNAVKYAAAAMYYVGLCHWENADEKKALAVWTELAQDVDYSKHYLAAGALNRLAEALIKQEQVSRAIEMYAQVAVDFRRTHREAAWEAIQKVVAYHVRSEPNEEKLRAFYLKVRTFHHDPRKVPEDVSEDREYWGQVLGLARAHGRFEDTQRELKERYYRYWAGEMQGKFPDWDDFQIAWAGLLREADGDVKRWMDRLDQQFKNHQKKDDYARIVKWIRLYGKHKAKALSYYKMIDFSKMKKSQIRALMLTIYDDVQDVEMARSVFNQLKVPEMPDREKVQIAHDLYRRDAERVPVICGMVSDRDVGLAELLRFYHYTRNTKEGLPVADRVISIPRYAKDAVWKKAELHEWGKQYKEAIAAYQRADNPPDNLWRIASCYVRLGKVATAIAQLKEVEAFFKDHAPEAALRIAHLWKGAGNKKQHIASLRGVLKKYPKSGQSSRAHQELEALGIRIGGGIDASD